MCPAPLDWPITIWSAEQTIDIISQDTLLYAGPAQKTTQAGAQLATSFRDYIEQHRAERICSNCETNVSLRLCAMIHAIAGSSTASGSTSRSICFAFLYRASRKSQSACKPVHISALVPK